MQGLLSCDEPGYLAFDLQAECTLCHALDCTASPAPLGVLSLSFLRTACTKLYLQQFGFQLNKLLRVRIDVVWSCCQVNACLIGHVRSLYISSAPAAAAIQDSQVSFDTVSHKHDRRCTMSTRKHAQTAPEQSNECRNLAVQA